MGALQHIHAAMQRRISWPEASCRDVPHPCVHAAYDKGAGWSLKLTDMFPTCIKDSRLLPPEVAICVLMLLGSGGLLGICREQATEENRRGSKLQVDQEELYGLYCKMYDLMFAPRCANITSHLCRVRGTPPWLLHEIFDRSGSPLI
jgi:hypothetical protein